jgi:hypothetical protein
MISFLNAAVLAGLAGLALPVLIHLLAKPRPKHIPFSSIVFLRVIQNQKARSFRLRQVVLLILRTVAVACLVLGFARPVLRSASLPPRGQAAGETAWVVDVSLSMAREGVWSRTRQNAAALAGMMEADDRAAVVWNVPAWESETDSLFDAQKIVRLIRNREPGWQRGRTLNALNRAVIRMAGTFRPDPELFLFSDLQASGFIAEGDTSAIRRWKGTLFVLPCPGEAENRGVTRTGIDRSLLNADQPPRIFADVRDFGGRSGKDCMVRFYLGDRAVAQQSVPLKPGRVRTESVPVMEDASGWIWGKAQCEQDDFTQDDERWFCAFLPKSIRILIVSGSSSDAAFFRYALQPQDDSPSRLEVSLGMFDREWIPLLDRADAVFLVNPVRLSGRDVQSLRRYLEGGGGLFIVPGNGTDIGQWNDSFFIPLWGDTVVARTAQTDGGSGGTDRGFKTLGRTDADLRLFQGVFEKGRSLSLSPRFFRSAELTGKARRTVLAFSDGSPFLSELALGKGLLLFMGSGIHPEWSTLAFSPMFPPLAVRSAEMLAAQRFGTAGQALTGDSLSMTFPREYGSVLCRAELPSGERVALSPRMQSGRLLLTLPRAETPGVYRFLAADSLVGLFAVNPDPRESDFRPISRESLSRLCPSAKVVFLEARETIEKQIRSTRSGRELWREALALGLLLLIAETLIGAVWK